MIIRSLAFAAPLEPDATALQIAATGIVPVIDRFPAAPVVVWFEAHYDREADGPLTCAVIATLVDPGGNAIGSVRSDAQFDGNGSYATEWLGSMEVFPTVAGQGWLELTVGDQSRRIPVEYRRAPSPSFDG